MVGTDEDNRSLHSINQNMSNFKSIYNLQFWTWFMFLFTYYCWAILDVTDSGMFLHFDSSPRDISLPFVIVSPLYDLPSGWLATKMFHYQEF